MEACLSSRGWDYVPDIAWELELGTDIQIAKGINSWLTVGQP